MIVLDASAAIELLLARAGAAQIADRLAAREVPLVAPHLIDVEVVQVVRRLARTRELGPARARQVLDDLAALPLARFPHEMLVPRIWALRENATAYDACYLALAEALGATLLTCDAALARVPGCRADVTVVVP